MTPTEDRGGGYAVFARSVQGSLHRKAGRECQDASGGLGDGELWVIAAADGHGSADYPRSAQGAAFAVTAALETLLDFVAETETAPADPDSVLRELEGAILRRWQALAAKELSGRPFTAEELSQVSPRYRERYAAGTDGLKAYGSTLLAACGRREYWCGIQIGDGSCAAVGTDGRTALPIPGDPRCQLNQTTSLCDGEALGEFRHCFHTEVPAAVFLGTDGIDNSYAGTGELLRLYGAMALVWAEQGPETAAAEIRDYLPKISGQGSGDDVSLACAAWLPMPPETRRRLREALAGQG